MKTLIKNVTTITVSKKGVLKDSYVLIDADRIIDVGQMAAYKATPAKADIVLDRVGCIIMPGLINLHNHPCASLLKATGRGISLEEWVAKIALPMILNLDKETLAFGSRYQAAEMLQAGITTCLVHTVNLNDEASFKAIAEPAARMGIRQVVSKEIRHAPTKPLSPEFTIPTYPRNLRQELKLAETVVTEWNGAFEGLVTTALAIEAGAAWLLGNATSDEIIQEGAKLADALNTLITCHIAATPHIAHKKFKEKTGKGEIEYLSSLGALSEKWIFVHALNLSEAEIKMVAASGARIAHCPLSNAYSADGVANLPAFLEHNIRCGLGTDGCYVCGTPDIFSAMRFCAVIHNVLAHNAGVLTPEQAIELATIRAAEVVGLEHEIGSLEVGKKADMIIIDPRHLNSWPVVDLPAAIVHSMQSQNIRDVFVNGRHLVKDAKLANSDEDELIESGQKISDRLLKKAKLQHLNTLWGQPKY